MVHQFQKEYEQWGWNCLKSGDVSIPALHVLPVSEMVTEQINMDEND